MAGLINNPKLQQQASGDPAAPDPAAAQPASAPPDDQSGQQPDDQQATDQQAPDSGSDPSQPGDQGDEPDGQQDGGGQGSDTVGDDEGMEQATPEEQHAYDDFVTSGLEIIYGGGKVSPNILKLLDEDPADLIKSLGDQPELRQMSPSVALAGTAVVIVLEIVRRAGKDAYPDSVVLHGGKEILEELGMVAGKAGIHDYSQDELNKAFYVALDLYRETATAQGLLDPTQLKQEFGQIKQADASGQIGAVLPQLGAGSSSDQQAAPPGGQE